MADRSEFIAAYRRELERVDRLQALFDPTTGECPPDRHEEAQRLCEELKQSLEQARATWQGKEPGHVFAQAGNELSIKRGAKPSRSWGPVLTQVAWTLSFAAGTPRADPRQPTRRG